MKNYRFYCFNLEESKVIYSENKSFDSDRDAVMYAFKFLDCYFNISIFRFSDLGKLIKVAKLY